MISGISFVTSMIIAVKLGSYLLGIYGFFLLMRNYFKIANLGVPDSTTILIIHNKNDEVKIGNYEKNAVALTSIVSVAIFLFGIANFIFEFNFVNKYELTWEFLLICVIAIFTLYNDLFFKIYRVEGRVGELTFYQSVIQIFCFIAALLFKGRLLLNILLICYLVGNLASLFLFVYKGYLNLRGTIRIAYIKTLFNKGFFLFLFNFLANYIFLSTRTAVSAYYEVTEFGMFTFAYTLSNGIMVLIDALAALLIPKLIDRFNTYNNVVIKDTIQLIKINYTYTAYVLTWILIIAFTVLLCFLDSYYDAFDILIYMSLTVVLHTHAFPYSTLLMAKNKEKQIALCSAISLAFNILLILLLIGVLKTSYQYVIIATWFSYFLYSYLCIFFTRRLMNGNCNFFSILTELFPVGLLLSVICAILIAVFNIRLLIIIPLVLFSLMNRKFFVMLYASLIKLISNPKIIDIKH